MITQAPAPDSALPIEIPPPLLDVLARRLHALGDPTRLAILCQLRHGACTVTELATAIDAVQPNVSKHLGVLAEQGYVRRERDGRAHYYRLSDGTFPVIFDQTYRAVARRVTALTGLMDAPHTRGRS